MSEMKEVLKETVMPIENLGSGTEFVEDEPLVEVLGSVREFSQGKRWFRDTRPIPDIG